MTPHELALLLTVGRIMRDRLASDLAFSEKDTRLEDKYTLDNVLKPFEEERDDG